MCGSDALQRTSLYSVTRLPGLETPQDIFVRLTARPAQQAAACYTASRPVLTGRANTLLAEDTEIRGGVLHGRIASFRHLYNLRWLTGRYAQADLLLTAAELDWTGGAALVYQTPQAGETRPWADSPAPAHAVGVPHGAGTAPRLVAQRRGPCAVRFAAARRFGLCFGAAGGMYRAVRPQRGRHPEPDAAPCRRAGKLAAGRGLAGAARLRAVGALCGENTGRVRNAAGSVLVRAALALPQRAGADTPAAGIGGLVGVSLAGQDAGLYALECEGEVTGLLLGASAASSGGQADPAARCRAAQQVWQPAGVGGVPGSSACRAARRRSASGCPMRPPFMATPVWAAWLAAWKAKARCWPGRANSGPVQALAGYDAAVSPLAGQFFGGVAGYSAGSRCRAAAIRPPRRRKTRRRAISPAAWSAFCAAAWQTARPARRPRYTAAGLLAGWPGRCAAVRVADSRSAGAVCGLDLTGGAVGCTAADAVLENCAATGSVTALAGSAGGLAGRNEGTIRGGTPGGAPLTVCAQSGCAGGFAACNTGTVENAALSLDTLRLTGAARCGGRRCGLQCGCGARRHGHGARPVGLDRPDRHALSQSAA